MCLTSRSVGLCTNWRTSKSRVDSIRLREWGMVVHCVQNKSAPYCSSLASSSFNPARAAATNRGRELRFSGARSSRRPMSEKASAVLNLTERQLAALIERGRGWPRNRCEAPVDERGWEVSASTSITPESAAKALPPVQQYDCIRQSKAKVDCNACPGPAEKPPVILKVEQIQQQQK